MMAYIWIDTSSIEMSIEMRCKWSAKMTAEKWVFVSINSMFEIFVTAGFGQFCKCINVHIPQGLKKIIRQIL